MWLLKKLRGEHTVLSGAVLIGIITSEKNIKLARRQDAIIPPDSGSGGMVSKVFVHKQRV